MNKEIKMYNESKDRSPHRSVAWDRLIWIFWLTLPFIILSFFLLSSDHEENKEDSDSSIQVHPNDKIVECSVYTAPYVWDCEIPHISTSDSICVSIQLQLTTQIISGKERQLLSNYGAKWFLTSFMLYYGNAVRSYIRKYSYYNIPEIPGSFSESLLKAAIDVRDEMSQKYELPVEILDVKVLCVKRE